MALGDVTIFDDAVAHPGAKRYAVHKSGVAATINAGELVLKTLVTTSGANFVTKWTVGNAAKPAVGTDFIAGLAMSTSTDTATLNGVVDVMPNIPGMTYLIVPNDTTAWDTQAEYDALVGARVLLNTTAAGVQTILATDYGGNTTNGLGSGLVVEPLDISKYPGKVRFSIKQRLNYNN